MAVDDSKSALDLRDEINETLAAAAAIVDCVRVLTALEGTPPIPEESRQGTLALGAGHAQGMKVRDASMPGALWHAMELIGRAQKLSEQVAEVRS